MAPQTVEALSTSRTPGLGVYEPLNNAISGISDNIDIYTALADKLDISRELFDTFDPAKQAETLASLRKVAPDLDTTMSGDWLGIDGLNMNSITQGLGVMGDLYGTYRSIVGAGQEDELFDKKNELLDQQIANNQYTMDSDKASKKAMSGATTMAFKKEDPNGLGTVG